MRFPMCVWVLAAVAVLGMGVPGARGQLNASLENYKVVAGLSDELAKAAEKKADAQDFDALAALADKYIDALDRLATKLDGIGSVMQESENDRAVASSRSAVLDAARMARDEAKDLRRTVGNKADPTNDIKDLRGALADLSDDYRTAIKDHDARLAFLEREHKDAHAKAGDVRREALRAAEEAVRQFNTAADKDKETGEGLKSLREARDNANRDAILASEKIFSMAESGASDKDLWDMKEKYDKLFADFKKADEALQARLTAIESFDDFEKAEVEYRRLVDEKQNPIIADEVKKYRSLADFKAEYKPMSL